MIKKIKNYRKHIKKVICEQKAENKKKPEK